jgi:hypothetical protein
MFDESVCNDEISTIDADVIVTVSFDHLQSRALC